MTTLSEEKAQEIRETMLKGGKSRFALIRDLINSGMTESDATEHIDKLASEIYQAPTAKERQTIRDERLKRANFGSYRTQILVGLGIIAIGIIARYSGLELPSILGNILTIIADYSFYVIALGIIVFLYGIRILMMGLSNQ